MSARVKRMLEMVSKKDQHTIDMLNQPMWETTKGSNLYNSNLSYLQKHLFEKGNIDEVSVEENMNPQEVENTFFARNSSSPMVDEMTYGFGKISNDNSNITDFVTTRNINILSCETILPVDIAVQPSNLHSSMKNSATVLVDTTNIASNANYDKSKETKCFAELQNVFIDDEENIQSPETDPFEDSGSEYIPSPVSSANSDDELSCTNDKEQEKSIAKNQYITLEQGNKNNRTDFNKNGTVKSAATNSHGKLKRDKREHCTYCDQNVTNFSRHLIRSHHNETEVIRIMSLEKKSMERKYLLEKIRKRGNFVNSYGKEGFINPVRRPKTEYQRACSDYLPCIRCKGFFLRTYLHRHLKICHEKINNKDSKYAQADGLLLLHMSGSDENLFEDLKRNVFPYMVSDRITTTVMNDFLIKYYGQRYYNCHKEKHLTNTVSQRMRELARFLVILQDKALKKNQLSDYLRPIHFDDLVNATNEMSGYDPYLDTFKSPSLALRWATVLKQLCDIAMFISSKKNETAQHKEFATLKQMIETQFRFYVSTNANKDLSAKKWKKGNMLPLTEDVIKISKFIAIEEQKCAEKLKCDQRDTSKLRYLTELLLTHVILLNRKRSGEAQRITINDYLRKEEDMAVQDIYESLTVTEKVLVKSIKRITIRGKKGRAVPVIFTKNMQINTEVLLESRKVIASSNPYLFANPNTENSFLWSNKVLKKIVLACNIENVEAITATCLRKHIGTIAQLISMGDSDLEQLSNHLGHEKATHLNFYRKTDDKLQIAKVSKLLLLMENKSVGEYRGKSLEEIDLKIPNLIDTKDHPACRKKKVENKSTTSNTDSDMEEEPVGNESDDIVQVQNNIEKERNCQNKGKKKAKNEKTKDNELYGSIDQGNEKNKELCSSIDKSEVKKTRLLIPWTRVQKRCAEIFFEKHLTSRTAPRKNECEHLKECHPDVFANKTWAQIKIFIVNKYNKQ